MQLPQMADVLVPVGAGTLVVIIALAVLIVRARRRQPRTESVAAGPEPTASDWTGEVAMGAMLPPSLDVLFTPVEAPAMTMDEPEPVAVPEPAVPEPVVPEPAVPEPVAPAPPAPMRVSAAASGSSRTVAAAVAQALAMRAAAARNPGSPVAPPRGDARDRLLAVLLNDPVRAVGAADELEACRDQLERLTSALAHERTRLVEVLTKLKASGLAEPQLARLAGLPAAEVHDLLTPVQTTGTLVG